MTYIAAIQPEFDALGMYSEKEKISIVQNGLNDRLRDVAMAHSWNTVQDMDLHLRTVEVVDELRKETESKTMKKPFFPRRVVNVVGTDETNESNENECSNESDGPRECEDDEEVLQCDCQAINRITHLRLKK